MRAEFSHSRDSVPDDDGLRLMPLPGKSWVRLAAVKIDDGAEDRARDVAVRECPWEEWNGGVVTGEEVEREKWEGWKWVLQVCSSLFRETKSQ